MAWTAPKDWVSGEVITASGVGSLNEQIRDNMLMLSVHAHTGVAGDGSNTLTNVNLTNIQSFGFADQSANPDALGELQRNGNNLFYYDGTTAIDVTSADQVAGTASLRTLGQSATQAAAGNHQHTISQSLTAYLSQGSEASAWNGNELSSRTVQSGTYTASGTNKVLAASFVYFTRNNYQGVSFWSLYDMTLVFSYNGVAKKTVVGMQTTSSITADVGSETYQCSFLPDGTNTTSYTFTAEKTTQDSATVILYPLVKIGITEVAITV